MYQAVAARAAKMQEHAAKRKEEVAESGRTTFIGTTKESERADRIAAVLFPVLKEVIPESLKDYEKRKNLLVRIFGRPDAYIKRSNMIKLYEALRDFKRQYLLDMKFDKKEVEIIFQGDNKRRKFMDAIKDIVGYSG